MNSYVMMIEKEDNNRVYKKVEKDSEGTKTNEEVLHIMEIREEDDIYSLLKKSPRLFVSLKGVDLPHEDTRRIESQIHKMLAAEIEKYEHSQQEAVKSKNEGEMIDVSLKGLNLPPEGTRRIESEIREMLMEEIKKNGPVDGDNGEGPRP